MMFVDGCSGTILQRSGILQRQYAFEHEYKSTELTCGRKNSHRIGIHSDTIVTVSITHGVR